ncbi:uncharacterized protein [Henckelia pumila]|uniref:uncharacterized protein n=1 Tax=Henckelia pumila TaxID=405737 RepID=UPI003C6DDEFD
MKKNRIRSHTPLQVSSIHYNFATHLDEAGLPLPRMCRWSTKDWSSKNAPKKEEINSCFKSLDNADIVGILAPTDEERMSAHFSTGIFEDPSPDHVIDQIVDFMAQGKKVYYCQRPPSRFVHTPDVNISPGNPPSHIHDRSPDTQNEMTNPLVSNSPNNSTIPPPPPINSSGLQPPKPNEIQMLGDMMRAMQTSIDFMGTVMQTSMNEMRAEFAEVRGEVAEMRGEFADMIQKMTELEDILRAHLAVFSSSTQQQPKPHQSQEMSSNEGREKDLQSPPHHEPLVTPANAQLGTRTNEEADVDADPMSPPHREPLAADSSLQLRRTPPTEGMSSNEGREKDPQSPPHHEPLVTPPNAQLGTRTDEEAATGSTMQFRRPPPTEYCVEDEPKMIVFSHLTPERRRKVLRSSAVSTPLSRTHVWRQHCTSRSRV